MFNKRLQQKRQVTLIQLAKLIATFCCGVFFGAAVYISLVQHPAVIETGNDFAARFFRAMYRSAAGLQASLALLGCITALVAWFSGAGDIWLTVAVLIGSVVPFTFVVIKPINNALLQNPYPASQVGALLTHWGYLHWVRTFVSRVAYLLCLRA